MRLIVSRKKHVDDDYGSRFSSLRGLCMQQPQDDFLRWGYLTRHCLDRTLAWLVTVDPKKSF
jgi:hypothetical protein